jgi:TonB family protein
MSLAVTAGARAAEDPPRAEMLAVARDLYGAAEYERALGILERLKTAAPAEHGDAATLEQYRALCLLALGRPADAEQAIAALVLADPTFVPSDAAMSPRLRSTFRDVRARTLPQAIQQRYDDAKSAFDRREFATAAVGFSGVLRMLNDPDLGPAASASPLSDIKTLSQGFRDLSTSAAVPPPSAPPASVPVAETPRAQAAAAPPAWKIFTADDTDVAPPVAERQGLPPFPQNLPIARTGILEVVIDERGLVESVTMRVSVNPMYDRMAVDAARSWRYRPATRAGVPVKFRKAVQISVKRQQ